jgi:hypothetical protein
MNDHGNKRIAILIAIMAVISLAIASMVIGLL